jgi:hypothetical protein
MIRVKVDVQCDKCGVIEHREDMAEYRISSIMNDAIDELEYDGWKFTRDRNWKLEKVTCGHCGGKR